MGSCTSALFSCFFYCLFHFLPPYVKIYEKDGLHSINPKYSVIEVTDDDNMRLIGRVVGLVDPDDMASEAETKELMEVFADELD